MPYLVFDQFQIGSLTIYTWGLMVGLAFTAGYFLTLRLAKKKNIAPEKIIWLTLVIFVGAIFGSRLTFLLQTPHQLLADPGLIWAPNSGAMFLGGLLGAIFFSWLYIKRVKLNFWEIADLLVLPLALGIGIGRIGCLLINDHLGTSTSLPWGILWPDGILRHPVAAYESLAGFAFFVLFLWLKNKTKRLGDLFLFFLSSYSVVRFLLDFTRQPQGYLADIHFWQLSTSQWLTILIFISTLFLWLVKKSKQKTRQ